MRRMWMTIGLSVIVGIPTLFAAKVSSAAAKSNSSTSDTQQTAVQRWAPENLNGTISLVDPKMDLVVVRDSTGVPFDFKVARSTRIDAGTKREELSQLTPKESVMVHFVPESGGDIARSIEVNQ